MSKIKDIIDLVERMEPLEERLGVTIEGLYASLSGPDEDGEYQVEINGELHSTGDLELEESLDIVSAAYDEKGRVISNDEIYINSSSFHMFETFSTSFYIKGIKPVKIRLYPKKS